MIPTNSISMFVRSNDSELRYMIKHFCEEINYPEPVDDVIQDFYLKLLTSRIIENYNPNWSNEVCNGVKMSTYMFPIIRNFVMGKLKSQGYKYTTRKIWNTVQNSEDSQSDDIDRIIKENGMTPEFHTTILSNQHSDNPDSSGTDLRLFKESFKKSKYNQSFSLNKRGDKSIKRKCTLLKIFNYLYRGYNNREIAKKFGVSGMTITILKHELAKAMYHYGFNNKFPAKKSSPQLDPKQTSLNGHKKEKIRNLFDSEKNKIKEWFKKKNGCITNDASVEFRKGFNPDVKIFQITGYIAYLHGQVKRGKLILSDMLSYEKNRTSQRLLWASYDSPKYAVLKVKYGSN